MSGSAGLSTVTLEPFLEPHLQLLTAWLSLPHVAPWYPRPAADLARASAPPPGAAHALIAVNGVPSGYLRWQHVDRETLDSIGLFEIPANSVDIDILIGELGLVGQGFGPTALNLLADLLLRDATVPQLGLTSSVANTRAHRAFEKAGFHIARQYDPSGLGPCHLLLRDLCVERAAKPRD
jgi:RimJ/RimL family protein N-acetyltransferase